MESQASKDDFVSPRFFDTVDCVLNGGLLCRTITTKAASSFPLDGCGPTLLAQREGKTPEWLSVGIPLLIEAVGVRLKNPRVLESFDCHKK